MKAQVKQVKQVKQVSEETKKAIQIYLDLCDKFKNAYFWKSPSSASQRRDFEKKNQFDFNQDGVELYFSIECSCKNIYVRKSITIDGVSKTAAALKKLL